MFKRILPILLIALSFVLFFNVKTEIENQDLIETELNIEESDFDNELDFEFDEVDFGEEEVVNEDVQDTQDVEDDFNMPLLDKLKFAYENPYFAWCIFKEEAGEHFDNNKKIYIVGGLVTLAACGAGGYYLYKNSKK